MTDSMKVGPPLDQLGLPPMELAESASNGNKQKKNFLAKFHTLLYKSNWLFQNAVPDFCTDVYTQHYKKYLYYCS